MTWGYVYVEGFTNNAEHKDGHNDTVSYYF